MPSSKKREKSAPFDKNLCIFCQYDDGGKDETMGKVLRKSGVAVHYFCMLFSSGLCQNGKTDKDGIFGFLPKDIVAEAKRGNRLRCTFCKKKGATIGCVISNCRRVFHLSCGQANGTLHQFYDTYRSYCPDHRPRQLVPVSDRLAFHGTANSTCPICMNSVEARASNDTLRSPCCRHAWFHRTCIQRHAISAGLYFFKCPLCNNKDVFQTEMLQFGIYLPDQDASWEQEPNAFNELLERYRHCDSAVCKCPQGREYHKDGSKWEIILCDWCGHSGCHYGCRYLLKMGKLDICPDCKEIDDRFKRTHKAQKSPAAKRKSPEKKSETPPEEKDKSPYPGPSNRFHKTGLPTPELPSPGAGSSEKSAESSTTPTTSRRSVNSSGKKSSGSSGNVKSSGRESLRSASRRLNPPVMSLVDAAKSENDTSEVHMENSLSHGLRAGQDERREETYTRKNMKRRNETLSEIGRETKRQRLGSDEDIFLDDGAQNWMSADEETEGESDPETRAIDILTVDSDSSVLSGSQPLRKGRRKYVFSGSKYKRRKKKEKREGQHKNCTSTGIQEESIAESVSDTESEDIPLVALKKRFNDGENFQKENTSHEQGVNHSLKFKNSTGGSGKSEFLQSWLVKEKKGRQQSVQKSGINTPQKEIRPISVGERSSPRLSEIKKKERRLQAYRGIDTSLERRDSVNQVKKKKRSLSLSGGNTQATLTKWLSYGKDAANRSVDEPSNRSMEESSLEVAIKKSVSKKSKYIKVSQNPSQSKKTIIFQWRGKQLIIKRSPRNVTSPFEGITAESGMEDANKLIHESSQTPVKLATDLASNPKSSSNKKSHVTLCRATSTTDISEDDSLPILSPYSPTQESISDSSSLQIPELISMNKTLDKESMLATLESDVRITRRMLNTPEFNKLHQGASISGSKSNPVTKSPVASPSVMFSKNSPMLSMAESSFMSVCKKAKCSLNEKFCRSPDGDVSSTSSGKKSLFEHCSALDSVTSLESISPAPLRSSTSVAAIRDAASLLTGANTTAVRMSPTVRSSPSGRKLLKHQSPSLTSNTCKELVFLSEVQSRGDEQKKNGDISSEEFQCIIINVNQDGKNLAACSKSALSSKKDLIGDRCVMKDYYTKVIDRSAIHVVDMGEKD